VSSTPWPERSVAARDFGIKQQQPKNPLLRSGEECEGAG
jgi:hypothetical protein